ncbi:MAG: GatB/YqeY domain-containing protein [Saprospiraceae bacterium]|nr:GatB/YqeY domain-containing protein [Saprospiraceae bacterium]
MALESRVNEELKNAMKAKDEAGKRGLRAIKQAILLQKTDGSGVELDEATEIKMLQKLVKQRKESLEIYEKQDREELAQIEREEIEVIERFLPKQMSESEISAFISDLISKTGASSMKDMGKVMGMANAQLAGRADGKTIASKVKELLS